MATSKANYDLARLQRRSAAYLAFMQGESFEAAARTHGIEQKELEDAIRLHWDSQVQDLAEAVGQRLARTRPPEIERIVMWLKQTMVWMFHTDADLVAMAQSDIDFGEGE